MFFLVSCTTSAVRVYLNDIDIGMNTSLSLGLKKLLGHGPYCTLSRCCSCLLDWIVGWNIFWSWTSGSFGLTLITAVQLILLFVKMNSCA